jgi:hypothetical protein
LAVDEVDLGVGDPVDLPDGLLDGGGTGKADHSFDRDGARGVTQQPDLRGAHSMKNQRSGVAAALSAALMSPVDLPDGLLDGGGTGKADHSFDRDGRDL